MYDSFHNPKPAQVINYFIRSHIAHITGRLPGQDSARLLQPQKLALFGDQADLDRQIYNEYGDGT